MILKCSGVIYRLRSKNVVGMDSFKNTDLSAKKMIQSEPCWNLKGGLAH